MNQIEPSAFVKSIVELYHRNGLVGEDRNIAKLFFVSLSKYLPEQYRLHCILISESGSGKTTLAKTVMQPFQEDVRAYSRFTGPGLDRNEESFDGKILFYEQMTGFESGELKLLLSEGKLTILVAERDEDGRGIRSVEHSTKGMPVFITTATNPNLDPEMLNRTLTASLDESQEQTRRILNHHAEQWSTIREGDPLEKRWAELNAFKTLYEGDYRASTIEGVTIPFAPDLTRDLPLPLNMRRDFDRLLRLTAVIAYAKSPNRPLIETSEIEGVTAKYIIGMPEDFYDALWCFGENSSETFLHFVGRAKEIHEFLRSNPDGVSTRDVARTTRLSQTRAYEYLESLIKAGFATKEKEGRNNRYYPIQTSEIGPVPFEIRFGKEEFDSWIRQKFLNKAPKLIIPDGVFENPIESSKVADTVDDVSIDRTEPEIASISVTETKFNQSSTFESSTTSNQNLPESFEPKPTANIFTPLEKLDQIEAL